MSVTEAYKKVESGMIAFQYRVRDILFNPVVRLLDRLGVTANGISVFRLVMLVPFVLLAWQFSIWAPILLAFLIVLDWVDGPLARLQKVASDRGKFTDIFADTITILVSAATLTWTARVSDFSVMLFIVLFGSLYLIATLARNEGKDTDWIINPYPRVAYVAVAYWIAYFLLAFFDVDIVAPMILALSIFMGVLFTVFYVRWLRMKP